MILYWNVNNYIYFYNLVLKYLITFFSLAISWIWSFYFLLNELEYDFMLEFWLYYNQNQAYCFVEHASSNHLWQVVEIVSNWFFCHFFHIMKQMKIDVGDYKRQFINELWERKISQLLQYPIEPERNNFFGLPYLPPHSYKLIIGKGGREWGFPVMELRLMDVWVGAW